jgi:mRNA interferase MazF
MLKPGDVVILNFPGAIGVKRRPAVVLSTDIYHTHRPDVIVGLLTTNIEAATAPTDYVLKDWEAAGLHFPSAFRSYILMARSASMSETCAGNALMTEGKSNFGERIFYLTY